MMIGYNASFPALHMLKALELIDSGKAVKFGWDVEDVEDVLDQASVLIAERGKMLTPSELSKLDALIMSAKEKVLHWAA
jgi:hypothetical protein